MVARRCLSAAFYAPHPGRPEVRMQRTKESDGPDLLVFDAPALKDLATEVRAGGSDASRAFIGLLRKVREMSRHDLTQACLLLWPREAPAEALREMILLHLDAGEVGALRQVLASCLDVEIVLSTRALLALLDAGMPEPRSGSLKIWPEENLPYAAKTSIFHVQEAIIARQKALIEKLLSHASGQRDAG